jgi:hypothetical protein
VAAVPRLDAVDLMTNTPGFFAPFGANSMRSAPALTMPFQLNVKSSVDEGMAG